ncbi:MAG TPA: hypothetical protein PKC24_01600 [Cyclobacteriaceae bacterium]|nr:hypothetical protein [Cyclobacteriaceae bacterium]
MEEALPNYNDWNNLAMQLTLVLAGLSVLIVLGHIIKLSITKDPKNKYEYINKSEINVLWTASIFLIIAGAFYGNSHIVELLTPLWLFVRIFLTVSFGLIAAFFLQNYLKFYYPFYVEKRLKALRYRPRISPKSGKPMKLLSEEEEDAYLDEGMQAEENVFSVDYDVWLDEETGFTKIEKYAGHLHAEQCPECNYQTFKVIKEEVVRPATTTEQGELLKHYTCGYCGHKARKTVILKVQNKLEESTATA